MKKSSLHSVIWTLLVAFSLASYIYMKNLPTEVYEEVAIEETSSFDEADVEESKVILPDIALFKKVIDFSKIVFQKK